MYRVQSVVKQWLVFIGFLLFRVLTRISQRKGDKESKYVFAKYLGLRWLSYLNNLTKLRWLLWLENWTQNLNSSFVSVTKNSEIIALTKFLIWKLPASIFCIAVILVLIVIRRKVCSDFKYFILIFFFRLPGIKIVSTYWCYGTDGGCIFLSLKQAG